MNTLDTQYQALLQDILDNGIVKSDRTGTGTISLFGREIRHNMADGFPLLTTKKMFFKGIVTELIWFLRGETNIKYLIDNNCHIWDGDAYKKYSVIAEMSTQVESLTIEEFANKIKTDDEFAKKWGELGPGYGKQWRRWLGYVHCPDVHYMAHGSVWYDQIGVLIHQLRTNPDSRRLMVNAWNVADIDKMVLPPCHYGFQCYTRELSFEEKIQWVMKNTNVDMENVAITEEACKPTTPTRALSLMWQQRSVDTFLGLPFNITSYGLLLTMLAKIVNMVPENLIGNLGDTHLYSNHIEQAKEQINRTPYELPSIKQMKTNEFWNSFNIDNIGHVDPNDFVIENYTAHPAIKAPLSN